MSDTDAHRIIRSGQGRDDDEINPAAMIVCIILGALLLIGGIVWKMVQG